MKKTLVPSSYELNQLLLKKYGCDIKTESFRALMGGSVAGILKGEKFNITFKKDEYLLLSVTNSGRALLDELMPVLNEVMGSEYPIAKYDVQALGMDEKDAMPTIEWDIKDPETRLNKLVNGRAYLDKSKIHNLSLYGDRKIESYVEDEKAKAERIANAKIYGIYPGSIKDVEVFNNMGELDLYFNIDAVAGHISRCMREIRRGRIEKLDLTEVRYALEYMVYQTTRFGVEIPEPQIDEHVAATPSYWAWFNFYNDHFKNVLTDEQWDAFQNKRRLKQDVSEYMPEGNWQDTLEEPLVKGL